MHFFSDNFDVIYDTIFIALYCEVFVYFLVDWMIDWLMDGLNDLVFLYFIRIKMCQWWENVSLFYVAMLAVALWLGS